MRKKNILALVVVLALSGLAAWLLYRQSQSTIKEELRDFAVADTGSVTRIFLASRSGKQVDLVRKDGHTWMVNDKFPARNDAVANLLATMKNLEVKSPVSKSEFDEVVKQLATTATKVEVYQGGDEPSKVYYVGGSTGDTFGTYMMIEGSSTPFVMHIPGFYGYLTTRYFSNPMEWRSAKIFGYRPVDISIIEVHHDRPGRSFRITGINEGKPVVTNLETQEQVSPIDTQAVYDYATLFQNVHGEYFATDLLSAGRKDTILNSKFMTIKIVEAGGETKTLNGYRNILLEPTVNIEGDTLVHDVDRAYGIVQGSDDVLVIQYFVFDPLTPRVDMFRPRGLVKN